MPWTTLTEPSLGLSILKAVLDRKGIACRVLHLNLFLLEHLRARTYVALANAYVLNDFLFSGILDPVVTNVQQRSLRQKVRYLLDEGIIDPRPFGGSEGVVSTLLRLRGEVLPAWVQGWADKIASLDASLIGFTCMFDQTIASIALARMVRDRAPDKMVVLGGYAVRSPTAQMILRSSPWIDAVCDGEGEVTIVELAHAAAGEIPLADVPGIVFRSTAGDPIATVSPPPVNLDSNPTPNYDDFFTDLRRLSEEHHVNITPPDLPIENSRGCWWGAKQHCVFCGIKNEDMAYRVRDAQRVLTTMAELRQRYGIEAFRFSDYILPNRYFDTLLPELARLGRPYRLGAEMKANITEERFALLAQAGFHEVQPGIESFSSDVLRKMHKGVSAVQNVHTLLLGRRFNVRIYYNLIYGFPGDDATEYERMLTVLPRLFHLAPPATCIPVQITRYAPLQVQPEMFGIERAQAEEGYELIFSRKYMERTGFNIEDFCYYFERPFENSVYLQRLYARINDLVMAWRLLMLTNKTWLFQDQDADGMTIRDKRGIDETIRRLDPAAGEVLSACRRPISLRELREMSFKHVASSAVEGIVEMLDALGLIFMEEKRLVSLVLPCRPVDSLPSAQDAQNVMREGSIPQQERESARLPPALAVLD
jgi:ribosomal peptide maturation radical SAM protein 1